VGVADDELGQEVVGHPDDPVAHDARYVREQLPEAREREPEARPPRVRPPEHRRGDHGLGQLVADEAPDAEAPERHRDPDRPGAERGEDGARRVRREVELAAKERRRHDRQAIDRQREAEPVQQTLEPRVPEEARRGSRQGHDQEGERRRPHEREPEDRVQVGRLEVPLLDQGLRPAAPADEHVDRGDHGQGDSDQTVRLRAEQAGEHGEEHELDELPAPGLERGPDRADRRLAPEVGRTAADDRPYPLAKFHRADSPSVDSGRPSRPWCRPAG
jgi:hypothetical protein